MMKLGATQNQFELFKYYVQNEPYDETRTYYENEFTNISVLSDTSKLVQATLDFNCMPVPYSYEPIQGKPVGKINNLTSLTAQNWINEIDINTYEDLKYYRDEFSNIPEEATQIQINSWDNYNLCLSSSSLYVCNCDTLYPNSGKGVIHPTVGYRETKYMTTNQNNMYQHNLLIEIPVTKNKTYYCKHFYPISGESDEDYGSFYGMVTEVRSGRPTYKFGTNLFQGCYKSTQITIPTVASGKATTISTTGITTLSMSTRYTYNNRHSDWYEDTRNVNTDKSVFYPWDSTSKKYNVYTGLKREITQNLTYYTTMPTVFKFTYSATGYIYLNVCRYSYDGVNYSPIPEIYEV